MIAPQKKPQGNGKTKPECAKASGRMLRGLAAVAAVVAVCGAVAYFALGRRGGEGVSDDGAVKQKPVEKAHSIVKGASTATNLHAKVAAATNAAPKRAKTEPPKFTKRPGAMQLPDGRVLTFKPPKEGEFKIVHSHGSTYRCDHAGNWEDITPKPIFDNSFEEALVGLSTTGNFIPGMLMGIDYDTAIKMLTKPVVISKDDSEEVAAKKEAVALVKEAILDYMKDGASLDDFVMEMRKQVVKERLIRGTAIKEIVASLKEGRLQDAADMRDAANKMLEKESLPPIKLPERINNAIEENR